MPTILVDYENVNGSDGLKGVDALSQDDTLIIFYSTQCERIRYEYIRKIEDSGCEFNTVKLKKAGKMRLIFTSLLNVEQSVNGEKDKLQLLVKIRGISPLLIT